ncbi:MAG: efflux RND transporter periplasmic adaptor subunit [Pirellulales bacterium]|nr:efflux RND transporter periplasmic adaptor subunit [Pirellulales bacterium]
MGTIVAVERSRVASRAGGQVEEYPLREGAAIQAGDMLAKLRTETMEIQLGAARALARQAEQEYTRLQAGYRPEEIAAAEARMKAAQAVASRSTSDLERKKQLFGQHTISQQELDDATFEESRAAQTLAELRADFEMKRNGYRPEEIEAARAASDAEQQKVLEIEEEIRKRTIRAPWSGYLVEKLVDVGEWVTEGGTVATLVNLDEVEVEINVDERWINLVQVGGEVAVLLDALPGATFAGKVRTIVPRSNWEQGSRSFPVIVRVKNELADGQPRLKEGMVARVEFQGPSHAAILAHKDSIVRASGKPIVFVVKGEEVRGVEVVEGLSEGEFIEITGDVHEGDVVVTEGAERVRPFEKVVVQQAPAADSPRVAKEPANAPRAPEAAGS